jgi:hypothetical protein
MRGETHIASGEPADGPCRSHMPSFTRRCTYLCCPVSTRCVPVQVAVEYLQGTPSTPPCVDTTPSNAPDPNA